MVVGWMCSPALLRLPGGVSSETVAAPLKDGAGSARRACRETGDCYRMLSPPAVRNSLGRKELQPSFTRSAVQSAT